MPVDFSVYRFLCMLLVPSTKYLKDTIITVGALSLWIKGPLHYHIMPTSATGQYDSSVGVEFAWVTIHEMIQPFYLFG